MTTTRELIDSYQVLYHDGTARDLNDMAGWYNRAREYLQRVDVGDEVGELIDLAYMVGRGECELLQLCGGFARAMKIRAGRVSNDLGDTTSTERQEASRKAHQLKADGARDFVARIADEYDVDPRTLRKWMKRYPPATRN